MLNIEFEKLNRKICIILDNCSSHKLHEINFSNLELFYLPPNTTSIAQPLDAGFNYFFTNYLGIIECSKKIYRKALLRKKLNEIFVNGKKPEEFNINFYTAANLFVDGFNSISSEIIKNCWNECSFPIEKFYLNKSVISEQSLEINSEIENSNNNNIVRKSLEINNKVEDKLSDSSPFSYEKKNKPFPKPKHFIQTMLSFHPKNVIEKEKEFLFYFTNYFKNL
jgi:hypothetical protein